METVKQQPSRPRPRGLGRAGFEFMKSEAPREKDVLVPVMARLAQRHLANVTDKNELDRVFETALAQHPEITKDFLQKFAVDFNAVPADISAEQFAPLFANQPPLSAVPIGEARMALAGVQGPKVRPTGPFKLRPAIDHFSPPQPENGYSPGETLTAVGVGFSEEAGKNKVELWFLDPDNPHVEYTLSPISESYSEIRFTLPPDIKPELWYLKVVVDGGAASDFVTFNVRAPEITITRIDPPSQEPGGMIVITGENFNPNFDYEIAFQNLDDWWLAPIVTREHTIADQPTTQIRVKIPNNCTAGNTSVQIRSAPSSNLYSAFCVAVPKYRVVYHTMYCMDETNWWGTEWGEDEIYTVWAIVADGRAWSKQTKRYYSFDEGNGKPEYEEGNKDREKFFDFDDAQVLTPSGGYAQVKYGLAIVTGLYETDTDEVNLAGSIIDVVGQVAAAIVGAAGGGSGATGATKGIAKGLKAVVKYLFGEDVTVGYDSNHPVAHPGPISKYWPAVPQEELEPDAEALQIMLPGHNMETKEQWLDFWGDGDHGRYWVSYKLLRQ